MTRPLALLLPLLLALPAAAQADAAPITSLAFEDVRNATATLAFADGALRIDVDCPGGLGELTLRRGARREPWPARVVVRLRRFAVLEYVSASSRAVAVDGRLGTDEVEVTSLVEATRKDPRRPATAKDAMPIVRTPGPRGPDDGRPVVRDDGWIDVTLPASVLDPAAESVRLRWIDAYRR